MNEMKPIGFLSYPGSPTLRTLSAANTGCTKLINRQKTLTRNILTICCPRHHFYKEQASLVDDFETTLLSRVLFYLTIIEQKF